MDYEKGTIGKVISYKDKELIKYFDLEKRFLATKHILKQTPIKKKSSIRNQSRGNWKTFREGRISIFWDFRLMNILYII